MLRVPISKQRNDDSHMINTKPHDIRTQTAISSRATLQALTSHTDNKSPHSTQSSHSHNPCMSGLRFTLPNNPWSEPIVPNLLQHLPTPFLKTGPMSTVDTQPS